MDQREAKRLISKLLECQRDLDSAIEMAEALSDDNERNALTTALKDVVGNILTEAIMPVVSQHPELNPYR